MQRELEGKRQVITGAASGIGRATRLLAAEKGARLVVDRVDAVEETAREIQGAGAEAVPVRADVSDAAAVAGFIERCVAEPGGIDGVYANAGISSGRRTSSASHPWMFPGG